MLEDEEKRLKILYLLDGLLQTCVDLYTVVSSGDKEKGYEFADQIIKVLNRMLITAKKLEQADDRIKLSLGIESIEYSLLRSMTFLKNDSLKKFQNNIEFKSIPLLREAFAQFYIWGYMVNRENGIRDFIENDRARLFRNDYIDAAVEIGQYKYDIAFTVTAYNHLDYTKFCVESLLKNIPPEYNYELILINHGSADGTKEYFEKINPTKQLDIKKNGGGVNASTRIIESEFVMQISNDVILTPGAIENMVACMKSDPKIAWVVPTTPNVSNLQTIEAKYSDLDELVEFGRRNNKVDHYRWEQRVRLCNPIALYRTETFLSKIGAGLNGYIHSSTAISFPDDRHSTLLRRSGYKMMLAKDAFCHHFGSVTLKAEIQRKGEKEFYSKGRIEFAKAFGIDPWGTGFCYDSIFLKKQIGNHQGHVEILGINCGIGSNPLKIKEQFKEYYHNLDVTLWNITDQERFLLDLKGISDFVYFIKTEKAFYEFLVDKKFDYIVLEENFLESIPFTIIYETIVNSLRNNGYIFININNQNADWLDQNKSKIESIGGKWKLIRKPPITKVEPNSFPVTYSQYGEDLVIDALFSHRCEGFYMDVGANDPDNLSNTKLFYNKGWHGINIEPTPHLYTKLCTKRDRDINLGVGVGPEPGLMTFYRMSADTLSSFNKEAAIKGGELYGATLVSEDPTQVMKLADILEANLQGTEIDFLSVDAVGYDLAVLKSNDWSRYQPSVIIVENNVGGNEIIAFLQQHDYTLIFDNGTNGIFVSRKFLGTIDEQAHADLARLEQKHNLETFFPCSDDRDNLVVNFVYGHRQEEIRAVHKGNISVIWSTLPIKDCDVYVYHNAFSYRGKKGGIDFLLMLEPVVVLPGEFDEYVWKHFDHIFGLFDTLSAQSGKFHKISFPRAGIQGMPVKNPVTEIQSLRESLYPVSRRKNAICMISGNKSSHVPSELYSKRLEAAQWFSKNSKMPFEVFGRPPFALSNYRGTIPEGEKLSVMKRYRYNLCFENTNHPVLSAGYVTEKILDCLEARTIPIYLGASNIEQYIPPECFIDFRKFSDFRELDVYLHSISEKKYKNYIADIDEFVCAGGLRKYSASALYDDVVKVLIDEKVLDGKYFRNDTGWKTGLSPSLKRREWKTSNGPAMWTWKHLMKAEPPLLENGKIVSEKLGSKSIRATDDTTRGCKSFLIGKKPSIKVLAAGVKFFSGNARKGYDYGWWNMFDALNHFENVDVLFFDYVTEAQQRGLAGMSDRLMEIVRKEQPDLLLYSPVDLQVHILHESLRSITDHTDTQTIIWMNDDHKPFDGYARLWAPCVDHIITTSHEAVSKYHEVGFSGKIIKSQWAFNPFTYQPLPPPRTRDVSFVGSEKGNRLELIEKMRQSGLHVDLFGSGWPEDMFIPFFDMVKIFSESKINLNLSNSSQIKRRNFEVPGCCGLLLTTPADNLEEYYEPDKEVVIASSLEELIDKSRYYLAHERQREEIAQRGYERTLAEHTWTHRLVDIFKHIGFSAVAHPLPHVSSCPFLRSAPPRIARDIFSAGADTLSMGQENKEDIDISIAVGGYNQLEYTRQCVESILHYTDDPYELLLMDNGSTDGTFEYFERVKSFHHNTRVIRNFQNRIVEANSIYTLSLARGKYIVAVANDTMVHDGWLKNLVTQIETAPDIGMVGPRSNNVSGPQAMKAEYDTLETYHTFAADWSKEHRGENFPVDRMVGMLKITKKSVFDRIGGADPNLPTNGRDGAYGFSDDDFSLRFRLAGYKSLVANDVFIHHFGSVTASNYRPDLFGPALNINQKKYWQKLQQNERIIIGQNGEITLKPYGADEDIPVAKNTIIRFPRICIVENDTNTSAITDSLNSYTDLAASYNHGESVSICGNSTQTWITKTIMKEEYDFIVFIDKRLSPSPEKVRELIDTALCYPDVAIMVPIGNYAPLTHDSSTEKMNSVEIIEYADLSFCVINLKLIRPFIKILAQNIDNKELFWFLQRRIRGEGYFIGKAGGIIVDIDEPCIKHPYDAQPLPEQLVEKKKYAEAIAIYKEDLSKDPDFVDSLYRLALIARKHDQVPEAIQYAEHALRIDPHHIQSLIFLSKVFIKQGDLELAETVVRLANFKQPGNIEVQEVVSQYEELKNLHNKSMFLPKKQKIGANSQQSNDKGDQEKALHYYETAARLEPDNITSLKNLADFYYVEQGRVEDALKIYVDILAKEPKNLEILLIIGHTCVSLQKFDDAKVFYNRVLEIEPQNKDARQNLDKILSRELSGIRGQGAENNIISDNSLSESPEDIYQSIQPLIKEKQFDKAIEKLEQLLESYPGFSLAHNDLGVLYYEQGNKEKALDHYEKAAELESENMTFQKNLADFYCAESGRIEDALRIYNRVLESEPKDLEALFAIGYICESLQQFEDAKIFYNKILDIEPWNENAHKNLDKLLDEEMTGEISEKIEQKLCNTIAGSGEKAEPASEVNQDIKPLIAKNGFENTALAATIIINCSSKKKELNNCLQSIKNNTFLNYNIIFINTGVAKGTLKLMKRLVNEHKDKKYSLIKKKKNSSLADAYNDGLKIAAGKYLVLMHDDVVVPENWLSDMIECMNINFRTGLVGPISNNADRLQKSLKPGYQSFDEFFNYSKDFREVNRHRRIPSRKLSGFCVMLKQEVIEKTGLFYEKFNTETFMMQDYCLRAIVSGYENVIAGDVCVHHNDDCKLIDSTCDKKGILHAEQKVFFEKWSGLDAKSATGKGLIAFNSMERADEFSHKGDVEKAVDALLHGIGSSHNDRSLYVAAAKILVAAKQFQDAIDTLDEISQIKEVLNTQISVREEADILKLKGFCMAGLGRDDEAKEYAGKALLLDQNFAPALNLKGMLVYKEGNNLEAEKYFKMAVAADPSSGEAYTNLGAMKWESGEEEVAMNMYEKAFILTPAVFDIATLYHTAMTVNKQYARCEKFSREAAELFPNNKKIEYMLIDMLIKQNKHDEAMEKIESAIVKFGIDDGILAAADCARDILGPIEISKSSKKDKTVSLCMIVKNEEKYLAKCLKSIKPAIDEMIVIDTGSTDKTSNIARVFGAKVYDYKWKNDFSDARNYSIDKASGAWIFTLDADEVISSRDYEAFRNLIDGNTDNLAAYLVTTRNYTNKSNTIGWMFNSGEYPDEEAGAGWLPTTKARLFHNNSQIRFDYPVHEMLDLSLIREQAKVQKCDIPVHHYGKLDEKNCTEKGEKYYLMGISKLEEMGDSEIALRELAVQAGVLGKNEDAIDLWQRFLALDLDPANQFIGDAYINMASAHGRIGRYEDASNSSKKAMELFPDMKEAPYSYAYAELYRGNAEETISIIEKLLVQFPEYPPACFLQIMAYICNGMKKKGMDGLEHLKKTLTNLVVSVALHEFVKGLVSANKIEYSLLLLEAAMESNITSKDILSLFSECLKKRDDIFASEKAA